MDTTLTAATALPLAAGWAAHATVLHRRLGSARKDPLTGLHTRRILTTRTVRRLTEHNNTAVIIIDANGFKKINDTFGHHAGDGALTSIAHKLHQAAARGVALRLGGDEFAAIIPTPPNDVTSTVKQLHHTLNHIALVDGRDIPVTVSIGAAHATPGSHLPTALRIADEAMYTAKRTGGGYVISRSATPAYQTANGRRAGRPGTHTEANR